MITGMYIEVPASDLIQHINKRLQFHTDRLDIPLVKKFFTIHRVNFFTWLSNYLEREPSRKYRLSLTDMEYLEMRESGPAIGVDGFTRPRPEVKVDDVPEKIGSTETDHVAGVREPHDHSPPLAEELKQTEMAQVQRGCGQAPYPTRVLANLPLATALDNLTNPRLAGDVGHQPKSGLQGNPPQGGSGVPVAQVRRGGAHRD